ncbi:XRE family transcriptional regulator [Caballeronia sp. BR00000012568055]|uniref:XRE family transcriptional regulator n=1 Tax=Caballeronia sp. BR00000012568055 TaxID=2918761 RepID=UPI0023F72E65|nr:XRE family transcriptional regulator [Caballeronia sp. BR00000012568055]
MPEALINPSILVWARQRSGIDVPALAKKIGTDAIHVASWEIGESRPTFRQARRFAELTHIPFGYLYLAEPPEESLPIADFRTVGDAPLVPLGADFRELLNDVLRKQNWYREYRIQHGENELPFAGSANVGDSVQGIAADIQQALRITSQDRIACKGWEDYLRLLIARIEDVGILVMRSGIVGGNTHRALSVDEFRGFVLADRYVPVIFLNSKDAKPAQIFTLMHELAHVWLGASGVSNEAVGVVRERLSSVERWCNAVAAQFLIPEDEMRRDWSLQAVFVTQVSDFARRFKVSRIVAGRRAFELGLVAWVEFNRFYQAEREQWAAAAMRRNGGGNPYQNSATRNSRRLTKAVLETTFEGRMLLRDAGNLLGVKPANLRKLADSVYGDD